MSLFKREPKSPKIEFLISEQYKNIFPEPVEAKSMIPGWYKSMPRTRDTGKGPMMGTFKSCPPLMDTFTAGYIIPFPATITVRASDEGVVNFDWRGDFGAVSTHEHPQIEGTPWDHLDAFKFHNPWVVRTPPGYSTLFTAPFNHGGRPYSMFTAIVDTDMWNVPVNFPFVWTEYPYTGAIDDGDPMIQLIPFKREDWRGGVRTLTPEEEQEKYAEGERVFTKNRHYRLNKRQRKSWTLREDGMPDDELHRQIAKGDIHIEDPNE